MAIDDIKFEWGGRRAGRRKGVIDQIIDELKEEIRAKKKPKKTVIAPNQPINTEAFEEIIEFIPNKPVC